MTPKFKSLPALFDYFNTEDMCVDYLVGMRWPNGIECPHCGHSKVYTTVRKRLNGSDVRNFKCASSACYKKFTPVTGTYMEGTKISFRLWIAAFYLCASHKKSISSVQLGKFLDVSQKTGWFILHRVRSVMQKEEPSKLVGIVEVDETYIGGRGGKQGRLTDKKQPVLGMVERGGQIRVAVVKDAKTKTVLPIIEKIVAAGSVVITDEWKAYNPLSDKYFHETVNHSLKQYVRDGLWHTNTIESFWSQLKRQIFGTHHFGSRHHLAKYVNECAYKWNTRALSDFQRFERVISAPFGRLTYEALTSLNRA